MTQRYLYNEILDKERQLVSQRFWVLNMSTSSKIDRVTRYKSEILTFINLTPSRDLKIQNFHQLF